MVQLYSISNLDRCHRCYVALDRTVLKLHMKGRVAAYHIRLLRACWRPHRPEHCKKKWMLLNYRMLLSCLMQRQLRTA